jgi:hypothetical protein
MSQYKEKLNSYELRYFQKFFGTNIKRLLSLRKSLTKRIHSWYWYDCYDDSGEDYTSYPGCQTVQKFKIKGGKERSININRKMIDLYIESLGYKVSELIGPRFTKIGTKH